MAVTGSGTQADPYIVTNYTDFISLSNHVAVEDSSVYIQFFDNEHPNQTIDCNTYGSEFKWGQFVGKADVTTYINLNGCTIKNFLIDSDCTMFYAVGGNDSYPHWHAAKIEVSNGSIRNVFMASASSKLIYGEVTLRDVSISMNVAGTTEIPISGIGTGKPCYIDNCALYLVASTLSTSLMKFAEVTDTDIEIHIGNQNNKAMFPDSTFTDCRFTGKVSGVGQTFNYNADTCVLDWCGMSSKTLNFTNCVVDLDLTDGRIVGYTHGGSKYDVFLAYNGANFNTNVVCNSHRPIDEGHEAYYGAETAWNFMSHEDIRNGTHLNDAGFTVVEVVGS